jgi:hypothetical protein
MSTTDVSITAVQSLKDYLASVKAAAHMPTRQIHESPTNNRPDPNKQNTFIPFQIRSNHLIQAGTNVIDLDSNSSHVPYSNQFTENLAQSGTNVLKSQFKENEQH